MLLAMRLTDFVKTDFTVPAQFIIRISEVFLSQSENRRRRVRENGRNESVSGRVGFEKG